MVLRCGPGRSPTRRFGSTTSPRRTAHRAGSRRLVVGHGPRLQCTPAWNAPEVGVDRDPRTPAAALARAAGGAGPRRRRRPRGRRIGRLGGARQDRGRRRAGQAGGRRRTRGPRDRRPTPALHCPAPGSAQAQGPAVGHAGPHLHPVVGLPLPRRVQQPQEGGRQRPGDHRRRRLPVGRLFHLPRRRRRGRGGPATACRRIGEDLPQRRRPGRAGSGRGRPARWASCTETRTGPEARPGRPRAACPGSPARCRPRRSPTWCCTSGRSCSRACRIASRRIASRRRAAGGQ